MFDAIKLALLVMQMLDKLFDHWRDKGLIDQGRNEEIAATARRIAAKTGIRDEIRREVDAMPEEQVDAELGNLGATGSDKPGNAGKVHPGTG